MTSNLEAHKSSTFCLLEFFVPLKDLPTIIFRGGQAKRFLRYLDDIKFYLLIKQNQMGEFFATPIKPIPVRSKKLANKLCTPLQRCLSAAGKEKEVSLEQLSKEVGRIKCKKLKSDNAAIDAQAKNRKEDTPFLGKKCTIKGIIDKTAAKRKGEGYDAQREVFIL